MKNTNDGPEREIKLKKVDSWQPLSSDLPDEIVPPGLSLERQWYLYNKIHEFCPAHCIIKLYNHLMWRVPSLQ